MIALHAARTLAAALAVSVSSFGMPAYAAADVDSTTPPDASPVVSDDGAGAPMDLGAHTDVSLGFGTQTSGGGLMVGHRMTSGLRFEAGLGTLIKVTGFSASAGYSGTIYTSARSRVEIPVLATFVLLSCTGCGDDSEFPDASFIGAMTGVDWSYGRSETSSGLVLSLRAGIAALTDTDRYDDSSMSTILLPLAQLGVGFTF
jgi:hypothetical protein